MKKQLVVLSAAAMVAAAAVPAMALENEFHGMYKMVGYYGNFFEGTTFNKEGAGLAMSDVKKGDGFFAEQRARLQYIAKANDNLKLVTHFELDTRFGGKKGTYLGAGNDAGNIDADQLTLETKNIYLDFNCPITGANMKVGMQPWADSYQSLFGLADMTGVYATKKFDAFTGSLGWFRYVDDDQITVDDSATVANEQFINYRPGDVTSDLFVVDGKFAINKDAKVGLSYYGLYSDLVGTNKELHTVGVNADMNFGGFNLKPFAAYQTGESTSAAGVDTDMDGWMAGAVGKIKTGNGAVNFTAIYLSGDENPTLAGSDRHDWQVLGTNQTYFNAANMWLLVRNGQAINSSTSVLGNDLTVGGRGLMLGTLGYEGTAGKVFYNANAGYAQTAEEAGSEDGYLGCEANVQVGYKLFDNLSVSVAGAYMVLGDGLNDKGAKRIYSGAARSQQFGAPDADDPYMANVQLAYTF